MMWEAFILLAWARFLKLLPFAIMARSLGVHMEETDASQEVQHHEVICRVARAVHTMSHYTLWESQCLVQAVAALKMLARRGIGCTLYLGTAKDDNGRLIAHAWLRSGTVYVTGARGMQKFVVVSKFAKRVEAQEAQGAQSKENAYERE